MTENTYNTYLEALQKYDIVGLFEVGFPKGFENETGIKRRKFEEFYDIYCGNSKCEESKVENLKYTLPGEYATYSVDTDYGITTNTIDYDALLRQMRATDYFNTFATNIVTATHA